MSFEGDRDTKHDQKEKYLQQITEKTVEVDMHNDGKLKLNKNFEASTKNVKSENPNEIRFTVNSVLDEIPQVFPENKCLTKVAGAAREVIKLKDEDLTVGDAFKKIASWLELAVTTIPRVETFTFIVVFSALSAGFYKIAEALKLAAPRLENSEIYASLQLLEEYDLKAKARGLEDLINTHVACFKTWHVEPTCTLQDMSVVNDTIKFLGELKTKIHMLLETSDQKSARRASTYVNLYFRLASLRSMFLWQVYIIKKEHNSDQLSKKVFAMIEESKKYDIAVLDAVTEVNAKKAVFLSVFHPTENEHFINFLTIYDQEHLIPRLGQDKSFISREYTICLSNSKLFMPRNHGCIYADKRHSDECKFVFVPVAGREMDNIFYLRSARYHHYAYMDENKFCYSVKNKPGSAGQWKLIKIEKGQSCPLFIIFSLMEPGWVLFRYSGYRYYYPKGAASLLEAKGEYLWEIHES